MLLQIIVIDVLIKTYLGYAGALLTNVPLPDKLWLHLVAGVVQTKYMYII